MSIMVYNLKFVLGTKYQIILQFQGHVHLKRRPKVKTNFATYPKLGHGREHDLTKICPKMVLRTCLSPKTLSRTRPQDIMSTYILISNFMKINQDIISTHILIPSFVKINQDIIVT